MTHAITGAILGAFERPAGSTFDPGSIGGLALWLDANDASTFTFSSGSIVSQWNDKSGSARHFTQVTVAKQANRNGSQNGKTTVVFDGIDDILNGPSAQIVAQPNTIFFVCKIVTIVSSHHLCDGDSVRQLISGDSTWRIYGGVSGSALDSGVASDTSWHVLTVIFNGASSVIRKDLSQIAAGGVGTDGMGSVGFPWYIGSGQGGNPTNCQFGEILVYNSVLGSTNRDAVESYLKSKWGTP